VSCWGCQVPYYDYALDMVLDVELPMGECKRPASPCRVVT
jgi:hypothetical protein